MLWDEIVKKYPNKWVVLKNVILDGVDVVSAEVVDVKTDDEISSFKAKNRMTGYTYRRTTEEDWNGIIVTSFVSAAV